MSRFPDDGSAGGATGTGSAAGGAARGERGGRGEGGRGADGADGTDGVGGARGASARAATWRRRCGRSRDGHDGACRRRRSSRGRCDGGRCSPMWWSSAARSACAATRRRSAGRRPAAPAWRVPERRPIRTRGRTTPDTFAPARGRRSGRAAPSSRRRWSRPRHGPVRGAPRTRCEYGDGRRGHECSRERDEGRMICIFRVLAWVPGAGPRRSIPPIGTRGGRLKAGVRRVRAAARARGTRRPRRPRGPRRRRR